MKAKTCNGDWSGGVTCKWWSEKFCLKGMMFELRSEMKLSSEDLNEEGPGRGKPLQRI